MNKIVCAVSENIRFWCMAVYALFRTGIIAPAGLIRLFKMAQVGFLNGSSLSALSALSAARYPDRVALIDEDGELTFTELNQRVEALSSVFALEFHLGKGSYVAIMCRNHRGFVEATLAASRLGANLLFLNTDFPGAQLRQVLSKNIPDLLVFDEEFTAAIHASECSAPKLIADKETGCLNLKTLIDQNHQIKLPRVRQGKIIVLTSGTTGLPKGAERVPTLRAVLSPFVTLLSRLPIKTGMPTLIATPLFHGFGLAAMAIALPLGAPMILRKRFDAEETIKLLGQYKVGVIVVVPLMLQRILLRLPERERLNDLSAIISGGAPLRSNLVEHTIETLGLKLFNLYGTSEAGFVSMATPLDLQAASTTIGRRGEGVALTILNYEGRTVDDGEIGRICVGGKMVFDGYSHGKNDKKTKHGFIDTGDLGYLDTQKRLFLCGRQDDMIVSGGENVFPIEVENVLARHPDVEDVAVIPVVDEEFGQCLHAFIVKKPAAELSEAGFKDYLQQNLARYKIPKAINLVSSLPRNALGKENQKLLRETNTHKACV